MAYQITTKTTIAWVGDGTGQMSVPSAQALSVTTTSTQVPGNDTPSTGNITTATNAAAVAQATLLNAQIGVIQGWASGNP